jgi:hypothetical protein
MWAESRDGNDQEQNVIITTGRARGFQKEWPKKSIFTVPSRIASVREEGI